MQRAFLGYGWLLPVLMPLAQVGGRALFNVLAGIYVLWGLAAVMRYRPRWTRLMAVLYALLLLGFLVSLRAAVDPGDAFKNWLVYALHSTAFPFTLMALQQRKSNLRRLVPAWGVAGVILLGLLWVLLPWQMHDVSFEPTEVMKEDNLPFLAPFMLLLVIEGIRRPWLWRALAAVLVTAILGYVVFSQGRASLVAFVAALLIFTLLARRWKVVPVAAMALLLLAMAVGLSYKTFFRSADLDAQRDWVTYLDRFSSGRTEIWRHALKHPPEPLSTGVGMGQVGHYKSILSLGEDHQVKHLHNFIFDAWYETGLLGMALMLLFLGAALLRGGLAWRTLRGAEAQAAAVFVAAFVALLIGASLSFSYASRQMSLYLFVLIGGMEYLYQQSRRPAGHASAHTDH